MPLASVLGFGTSLYLIKEQLYYINALSRALLWSERRGPHHALQLLECWLDFEEDAYIDISHLQATLMRSPLSRMGTWESQAKYLVSLAGVLCSRLIGRSRDASLVLEAWLERPVSEFLAAESRLFTAHPVTQLHFVQTWLEAVGPSHPLVLETCEAVVQFLQKTRSELLPRVREGQWSDIFVHVRNIGRTLVSIGCSQADRADSLEKAEIIVRRLLTWSEAFENALLRDRWLTYFGVSESVTAQPRVATRWPWQSADHWSEAESQKRWLRHWIRLQDTQSLYDIPDLIRAQSMSLPL